MTKTNKQTNKQTDKKHHIQLDYYAKIFQSLHMTYNDPVGLPTCDPIVRIRITITHSHIT